MYFPENVLQQPNTAKMKKKKENTVRRGELAGQRGRYFESHKWWGIVGVGGLTYGSKSDPLLFLFLFLFFNGLGRYSLS